MLDQLGPTVCANKQKEKKMEEKKKGSVPVDWRHAAPNCPRSWHDEKIDYRVATAARQIDLSHDKTRYYSNRSTIKVLGRHAWYTDRKITMSLIAFRIPRYQLGNCYLDRVRLESAAEKVNLIHVLAGNSLKIPLVMIRYECGSGGGEKQPSQRWNIAFVQ